MSFTSTFRASCGMVAIPPALHEEASMFPRIVASFLALLVLPAVSLGQSGFKGIHNASEADYQKWVGSLGNMHAVHVSAFGTGHALRFAAIATDAPVAGWYAQH